MTNPIEPASNPTGGLRPETDAARGAGAVHMANGFDPSGASAATLDPETARLIARRDRVLGPSYRLFYEEPVALVRGEGVELFDRDGNAYLDAYNNVPAIGHSHPRVREAVSAALDTLNTHTRYLTEPVIDYSERLLARFPAPLERVTYACTGSEAIDLAVRTAKARTGRSGIIVTASAYHGTTVQAAGMSPALGPNNPLGPDVVTIPSPWHAAERSAEGLRRDVEAAIAELDRRGLGVAALVIDSVLSSDGVITHPLGFLAPAADAVRAAGGLYIADEVQPGFGRLGTWWGFERHGVVPDLAVLGKPMGNGLPISAVVGTLDAQAAFGRDVRYFNTFAGSPASIAAASAVLDVIEHEDLVERAAATGEILQRGFAALAREHAAIGAVRGTGLFWGIDLIGEATDADGAPAPSAPAASAVVNAMRRDRVLISASGPAASTLKIRPPLPFGEQHAERLLDALDRALSQLP